MAPTSSRRGSKRPMLEVRIGPSGMSKMSCATAETGTFTTRDFEIDLGSIGCKNSPSVLVPDARFVEEQISSCKSTQVKL